MNQIMYKDSKEIKRNKKMSKLFKAIILILVGIILLCGSFLIVNKLKDNTVIFVPEETKLDLYIYENNVIIEAYNSQRLEYLTYKWDEQDSYTQYPAGVEKSSISVNVGILKGEHVLYVKVLDANGNETIKQQNIKGVTEAKISIEVVDGYFNINVIDEEKIESIEYEFNDISYNVDVGDTKEFSFMKKMNYGKNHIKVIVQNSQGIYSTQEMEYEY